jgi:hypothetical protein
MHGWQKKIDTRELAIVIDGPEGQWVVDVPAGHLYFSRLLVSLLLQSTLPLAGSKAR